MGEIEFLHWPHLLEQITMPGPGSAGVAHDLQLEGSLSLELEQGASVGPQPFADCTRALDTFMALCRS